MIQTYADKETEKISNGYRTTNLQKKSTNLQAEIENAKQCSKD